MTRFWPCSFALLLGFVQFLAVSNLSQADERASEKMLPKETLAFFTISNVPDLVKRFDKTSLGQMFHEPQLKAFLDDVSKLKEDWSKDKFEGLVGVSIDDFLQLPQGELTLAVVEKPLRKFAFVAMLEYGSNQETIDKFLKKLDEQLEKNDGEHSTEVIDQINVHIYTDKTPAKNDPIKTVTYFTDKSYFVLSNEVEAIKEVLDRWDGNSDDSLAQNEQYKYIQSQCKTEGSDPLIKVFLNPIGLIQTGIAVAQSSFPEIGMAVAFLPIIGIDGLKGYGGAMTFDEGEFETIANFFIYADAPRGLLGVFNFPATQLTPPKWVPESVGSYAVLNWNVLGAYTSVETLVDTYLGPGKSARQLEEWADQPPMINAKKDLIDNLDGKIHFIQTIPKETDDDDAPDAPLMFFGLGLKDVTKMKKTLEAAAKAEGSSIESREFNGETIYEFNQPDSDQTLSFAVTEEILAITNDTPMLEGMMRGQSGRSTALVDSDEYKRCAKFIPSKTSMQGFQRNDVQLKMYYDQIRQAESGSVEGLDFAKLPPFEVISKYFLPSASYVVPDKKGAKTVSFTLKRND